MVTINVQHLYGEQAKLDMPPAYIAQVKGQASQGRDVILTGPGPVWLYLAVALMVQALNQDKRSSWRTRLPFYQAAGLNYIVKGCGGIERGLSRVSLTSSSWNLIQNPRDDVFKTVRSNILRWRM